MGDLMENTKPILLVTSRAAWEKQYERYRRMGKRLNTVQGLLFIPFLASLLFLAGVLFPLVAGDIAFGHPGYYWYRAASDTALLIGAISFVLYAGNGFLHRHLVRRAHLALGLKADGTFVEVREVTPEAAPAPR
ncbi:hypothetical protein [Pseudarthrobacter sulfonivorans]|nr:hypothetical protein [Pseudarthrobacter sulfonivorans]